MTSSPGYSGTPLIKKLGIKEGTQVLPIDQPAEYAELLGPLPEGAVYVSAVSKRVDIAHVFAVRKAKLDHQLQRLRVSLRPDASVWVSWPKKASKVPTDITEDVIRAIALPMGYVDVKVCAVTEVWSGLKLMVRKGLR